MLSLRGPYGEAKQFAHVQGFGEGRERVKTEITGHRSLAGTDAPQTISRTGILQGGPKIISADAIPIKSNHIHNACADENAYTVRTPLGDF